MENNNTTSTGSITLWIFGQISYIFSLMTTSLSLDNIFKLLSIFSVAMVIVINWKKFTGSIKGWFSK
jgi:hypothetical protein